MPTATGQLLAPAATLRGVWHRSRADSSSEKPPHSRDSSGLQDQTKHIYITTITMIGDWIYAHIFILRKCKIFWLIQTKYRRENPTVYHLSSKQSTTPTQRLSHIHKLSGHQPQYLSFLWGRVKITSSNLQSLAITSKKPYNKWNSHVLSQTQLLVFNQGLTNKDTQIWFYIRYWIGCR